MATQALVMGFGGTGAHILTFLKELAVLKYGNKPESIRFLFFDTLADWKPGGTVKILGGAEEETLAVGREEGTSLDPESEYFFLSDHDPDLAKHVYEYLDQPANLDRYPHLKDWLHAPWLSLNVSKKVLGIVEGAAQQRQIGRFAMFQNAEKIVQQIRQEVKRLQEHAQKAAINVWLVGSSAGGTGAGSLLDAAFLTRLATSSEKVSVTGVIVLPEIYADKDGISLGRAYSLFRELDRFQEQGCKDPDHFSEEGRKISSRVRYDARGRLVAAVESRLFDNLFYVGRPCHNDAARTSFFSSVANAIDPFLDEVAGPPLLEASLNDSAAASSCGAARLYVPVETLAALFAWEEVMSYLEQAAAPRTRDSMVVDLAYGAAGDRRKAAERRTRNLLPLFKDVLDLSGKTDQLQGYARGLTPRAIVKEWYGFGGAAAAGMELTPADEQVALLTYVNPFLSPIEDDPDRVPAADRVTKTFQERRSANLPKENKAESRDRFAVDLEGVTLRFKDAEGAEHSFEKGRRLVFDKVSQHLRSRIDEAVMGELRRNPQFGCDEAARDHGTVLTRLYQELREILADQGPLNTIDVKVSTFIDALEGEEERLQQEAVRTIKDLKEWTPSALFGGSVDEPQIAARDASAEYLVAYQRSRLLRDMQQLVRDVKVRFQDWAGLLKAVFGRLVLDVTSSGHAETARQLRRLRGRLQRLAQNPTARISCSPDWDPQQNPDVEMLGYREKLRQECATLEGGRSMTSQALSGSSWELGVDAHGRPWVKLALRLENRDFDYDGHDLSELHHALYRHFRATIDQRIATRDVFDYLLYVQQAPHHVPPEEIARILSLGAEVLINAEAPETCHLVFKDPVDTTKRNLKDAIFRAVEKGLGNVVVTESHHSDLHAINVLKIRKPNLESINNLRECREDYVRWQQEQRGGGEDHDKRLLRAQVYHPFRPELEAWYVERRHFQLLNRTFDEHDHIPPRIVRLLEDPAMMQAFVHCVATGAVEKQGQGWIWHDSVNDREVMLTDPKHEPKADLVRAAVIFALQQREGREHGRIRINCQDAEQSAVDAAQKQGKTEEEAIQTFLNEGLDSFLKEHFPSDDQPVLHQRELAGLRMIFEFYGHPTTRPLLRERLDLSYQT